MAQVVKSAKQIFGFDVSVGSEWDAGYVPFGSAHRAVRVTVRKDADDAWIVYCIGRKGDTVLAQHTIKTFICETCAKAFALCLVHGSDYAVCPDHQAVDAATFFEGALAILLAVMGINETAFDALDEGGKHRIVWTVRELLDGQRDWNKVIAAWEFTEAEGEFASLSSAIRLWRAEMVYR